MVHHTLIAAIIRERTVRVLESGATPVPPVPSHVPLCSVPPELFATNTYTADSAAVNNYLLRPHACHSHRTEVLVFHLVIGTSARSLVLRRGFPSTCQTTIPPAEPAAVASHLEQPQQHAGVIKMLRRVAR